MNKEFIERSITIPDAPDAEAARELSTWAKDNWTSAQETRRTADGFFVESVIIFRDGTRATVAATYCEDQIAILAGPKTEFHERGEWACLYPEGEAGLEYFRLVDELQRGQEE